jgi:hypothetical protein
MNTLKGTYTSASGNYVLTITDYDGSGVFHGTYSYTGDTAQGKQTFHLVAGHWFHVNTPETGEPAVSVGFTAVARPGDYSYCIVDSWAGVITQIGTQYGTLSATGVRSYLLAGHQHELSSLDTQLMSAAPPIAGRSA